MLPRLLHMLPLLFSLSCTAAFAAEGAGVAIEVDAANPPFMYGSVTSAKGLYPALIETIFAMNGTQVRLAAKPWKRALSDLEQGHAGVAGLYKNSERSKKYDFSQPLFTERIMVFYNRQRPVAYHNLTDLNGKHVGVLAGWSYGDAFDQARHSNHFMVSEANSDAQNMAKLAAGRLDVVLAIAETGQRQIRQGGMKLLTMAPQPMTENQTYLAFSKKAGASALLQAFDAGLQALKKTQLYSEIIKNELSERP